MTRISRYMQELNWPLKTTKISVREVSLFWHILGVLWTSVLRITLEEFTDFKVDMFTWTGCGFGYFLMYFGSNYSSALLVIISAEKCIALYLPFKSKTICTVRTARIVSFVTALIFVAFDLQFFFISKEFEDKFGNYCFYDDSFKHYWNILFSVVDAVLYSYAPFTIMILCYSAIIYKFITVKWKNRLGNTDSTSQALSKSATTGIAMLLTVSFTFIILTSPIVIANTVWSSEIPLMLDNILRGMAYLNHGINGVLYCVSGSRFRNELKNFLTCKNGSHPSSTAAHATSVLNAASTLSPAQKQRS